MEPKKLCDGCHSKIEDGDQHRHEGETICPTCFNWEVATRSRRQKY